MANVTVSMPEELKDWIDAQARRGGYADPAEYIRALIRDDRKAKAEDLVEQMILQGFDSGPGKEMKKKEWAALRARVSRRVGGKAGR
ncbi:MAG: hypothetical protein K8I02_01710 [Candidatus Methylomirabilis sp.]|nr:hypothetical protein [Deltaproteobacteria bacterium]